MRGMVGYLAAARHSPIWVNLPRIDLAARCRSTNPARPRRDRGFSYDRGL